MQMGRAGVGSRGAVGAAPVGVLVGAVVVGVHGLGEVCSGEVEHEVAFGVDGYGGGVVGRTCGKLARGLVTTS